MKTSPIVITVAGLKKSGKTTVTEGIVAELRRRGYRVGSVKSMVHSTTSLDVSGKDTHRHSAAGSEFVIALSAGEIVYMERSSWRRGIGDISRLMPEGAQILICEGMEDPSISQLFVVCLRRMDDLEDVMGIRGVVGEKVVGISGLAASLNPPDAPYPVFDIMDGISRRDLVDSLLERSGDPLPGGKPGGPLLDEGSGWRPGVLPPGEFPEPPPPPEGEGG